jgi:hypothetical protein
MTCRFDKICTLREFLAELNKLVDENPERLDYKVLADWTYPDIEIQDNDGNEYDKTIWIG